MTVPLHFHDTTQVPAATSVSWSSPAKAKAVPGVVASRHGARAKFRSIRYRRPRRPRFDRHLEAARGRRATPGGAGGHAADRNRFRCAHRFSAVVGHPELLLDRAATAAGAIGRAVADAGRGVDPAVAAQ